MDIARRGRAWLIGIAGAGIALSHEFGYQVDNPGVAQKVHALEETGHAYLPLFVTLALIALTLGIVAFLAHRIAERAVDVPPKEAFLYTATRLLGMQAAGFLLLEVGERVLSGNGFTLAGSPVALALMMHVVLALLGAGMLRLLARVVDVVLDAVEKKVPEELTEEPATTWAATSVLAPVPLLLSGGLGLRGPPSSRL
jgi:hypothetical protein